MRGFDEGRCVPSMRGEPAAPREHALAVVIHARQVNAYLTLALRQHLGSRDLPSAAAALVTDLVQGSTRQRSAILSVIVECARRPASEIDADCRDLLCIAGYDYLVRGTPGYAVAATWVDVAGHTVPRARGFVNAVLRRLTERPPAAWWEWLALPQATATQTLARRHSHPEWLVDGLREGLAAAGADPAELEPLLMANNRSPRVSLIVWPPGHPDQEVAGGEPGRYSPYAVTAGRGLAPARGSAVGVQDEGSQLAALALVRAPMAGRDERWCDAMAGPGGKAALMLSLLSERAGPAGRLLAADRHWHRARLTRTALARMARAPNGARWSVVCADARGGIWRPGSFDRVLCDVPCSGSGAICRRPDARWRRQPDELPGLVAQQRDLLRAALAATRPGGLVLYSACSLLPAETVAVVDEVCAHGEARRLSASAAVADLLGPDCLAGTDLWLLPHRHHTDGMFAALLTPA